MIHQDSPKIHPPRVKLGKCVKGLNRYIYNFSLFMFHPFTPTPPRDARMCVFVCVCERGGERVNLEKCGSGRRAAGVGDGPRGSWQWRWPWAAAAGGGSLKIAGRIRESGGISEKGK